MNKTTTQERRRMNRRNISYYLPVMDNNTLQVIGHLVDISPVGIMMDTKIPITINHKYSFHLDFMEPIAGKSSLDFGASSKWCRQDAIQPDLYNAGFELADIAVEDIEVFKLVAEKYGAG